MMVNCVLMMDYLLIRIPSKVCVNLGTQISTKIGDRIKRFILIR